MPDLSNPFEYAIVQGAKQAAAKDGIELLATGNNAGPAEVNAMQDYIAAHVNVIGINSTDPTALGPVVKAATAAHIPVVAVVQGRTDPRMVSSVTLDWYSAGKVVGQAVATGFCTKYPTCKVAIVQGTASDAAGLASGNGLVAGLQSKPNVKIVAQAATVYDATKALNVTQNFLSSHSDLNFIPTWWSAGTLSAVQGIAASGKTGQVGTSSISGACPDIADVIKGTIYADSMSFPELIGQDFINTGLQLVHHQSVPKQINTPIYPITTDTAKALLSGKMTPPANLPVMAHLKQAQSGQCPH